MKDLDFDELDRAVNSLMTNVPSTPEPKKAEEQTLTITPTLKDGSAPSFGSLDKTVNQINTPPSAPAAMPAPKQEPMTVKAEAQPPVDQSASQPSVAARRGRFMDVVRPSTTTKLEPRPVSRQGVSLEPSGPLLSDVTPSTSPIPVVPKVETPPLEAKTVEPKSEWPDPLDMDDKNKQKLLEESDSKPEALLNMASASIDAKEKTDENYTPLESPFLSDAKVEKRPLGGAPTEAEVEMVTPTVPEVSAMAEAKPPVAEEAEAAKPDETTQLPATPTPAPQVTLPEELSGDLMAIESGENAALEAPEQVEKKTPEPETAKATEMPVPITSVPSENPTAPTGPVSIPQQYREEPSTGDKDNGSIYDTDTYHKPLAHPGKKKSGWLWVVWIILILLVGAGGGAALYYFRVF